MFFQARSPPKLSFHIQSVKVVELNGVGWGEPIRSIFTLEWKLHPTSQIISHSPSIKDFISKLLSSLLSSFFHWQHLKYENGSHKGIFFLWHLLLTFLCSLTTKENINENRYICRIWRHHMLMSTVKARAVDIQWDSLDYWEGETGLREALLLQNRWSFGKVSGGGSFCTKTSIADSLHIWTIFYHHKI